MQSCTNKLLILCMVGAALAAAPLVGQQTSPAKNPFEGNPAAIARGQSNFRVNCGFCHGANAAGGLRAPDLTTGRFAHGDSDVALFQTILRGIPGTLMPANDLSDEETWEIIAYLRSLAPRASAKLAGNPVAGEKLFFGDGNCSLCHMVRGKGGRLGPDLSRIAAMRPRGYIVESIRKPSERLSDSFADPGHDFPMASATVTVTLNDGQKITGVARNEDSFSIQLMDRDEQLHSFLKKDLKQVVHEPKSLMPEYGTDVLTEKQLEDLVAYLDTLRGN
jgi:putative heme-binding domain-containing protein